jgi:hypothetical protein
MSALRLMMKSTASKTTTATSVCACDSGQKGVERPGPAQAIRTEHVDAPNQAQQDFTAADLGKSDDPSPCMRRTDSAQRSAECAEVRHTCASAQSGLHVADDGEDGSHPARPT